MPPDAPAPTVAPARVAMYLRPPEPPLGDAVFGRDVAVDEFLAALLRHGEAGTYQFFQHRDVQRAQCTGDARVQRLAVLRRDIAPVVSVVSDVAELRRSPDRFRVWHDLEGELHSAATARSNYASTLYPLTAVSHVLSYAGLAHGWFLRMMLQDLRACDSLVCTSRAARTAAQNQFRRIAERLRRDRRGVDLAFGGRLDVIPLGVDTEVFRPRDKVALRRDLGLPEGAFLLLWLGRLSFADKADLLPLVEVFRRLVAANPSRDLVLLIAGTGRPIYGALIRRCAEMLGVSDRVIVREPAPTEQRHLLHAAADVFVSPVDNVQGWLRSRAPCHTSPARADYAVPAFVEDFGHYATSVLPANAALEVTGAGWRVLRREDDLPLHAQPFGVISYDLASSALALLGQHGGYLALGEITGLLSSETGAAPARAGRHVMWLVKYGLVRLADGQHQR